MQAGSVDEQRNPWPGPGTDATRREWHERAHLLVAAACVFMGPPDRTQACSLSMGGWLHAMPLMGRGADSFKTAWSSLRGRDPAELEVELARHFDTLFGRGSPARLELSESRFLAQRSEAEAAGRFALLPEALESRYALAHFRPVCRTVPPDHLGVELHFLADRLERAAQPGMPAETMLAEALAFVRDHLLTWVPALRLEIALRPEGAFFAGVLAAIEGCAREIESDLSGRGRIA